MAKQNFKKITCTAMAATLSASPLLPLVEAVAMNQEMEQEMVANTEEMQAVMTETTEDGVLQNNELKDQDAENSAEVSLEEAVQEEVEILEMPEEVTTPEMELEEIADSQAQTEIIPITEEEVITEEIVGVESQVEPLQEVSPGIEAKSTAFSLSDWNYTQTANTITLNSVKTNKTSYYIPGEYNGKQVILESLKVFPSSMTSLKISTVNGKKVRLNNTSVGFAFTNNKKLITLDLSGLNTSNITRMSYLFDGLESLTSLNLSGWNTTNVTEMSSMFGDLKSLTTLNLSSFNTSNVVDMSYMFQGMKNLKTLNIKSFNTSKVKDMGFMFEGLRSMTAIDVSHFNTANVQYMDYMFSDMKNISTLNLSNFNTAKVVSMVGMFAMDLGENGNADAKLSNLNIKSFNTANVQYMSGMFQGLGAITSLDLSHFKTSKVKAMDCMFNVTPNLKTVNLTSFDTSNVENMRGMFAGTGLTGLDLRHFETGKVTDMSYLFAQNPYLASINVSGWDTEMVEDMSSMFQESFALTSLDLSSFKTSKLKDVSMMFWRVPNLKFLDLSQFDFSKVEDDFYFFNGMYDAPNKTFIIGKDNFLYNEKNFSYAQINLVSIPEFFSTTTTVSGRGTPGTTIQVSTNGKVIGNATVTQSGFYQLTIPKQAPLTKLVFKLQGNQGLQAQKTVVVQGAFKNFTVTTAPTPSTTAIYGTGEPGSKVNIYDATGVRLAATTVNTKGNYKLVIPKQKVGAKLTLKQSKEGYTTVSEQVTVLNEFKTFTYNTPTTKTTAISGKGVSGAKVGIYTTAGKRLAITTVDAKGNYKLTIPAQKAGTKLVIKQAKSGYATASKDLTVLNNFKTFTTQAIANNHKAIYGTGQPGATVRAYVNGKAISAKATVDSKGNYKLVIPAQKAGTVVQIKMAKSGYLTVSQNVKVLKAITQFSISTVKVSSTTITGKGLAGAKVGVYTTSGKRLALVNTDSKGNYKLTIPKQKAGTKLVIKQAKTGYATLSKNVTVAK